MHNYRPYYSILYSTAATLGGKKCLLKTDRTVFKGTVVVSVMLSH